MLTMGLFFFWVPEIDIRQLCYSFLTFLDLCTICVSAVELDFVYASFRYSCDPFLDTPSPYPQAFFVELDALAALWTLFGSRLLG